MMTLLIGPILAAGAITPAPAQEVRQSNLSIVCAERSTGFSGVTEYLHLALAEPYPHGPEVLRDHFEGPQGRPEIGFAVTHYTGLRYRPDEGFDPLRDQMRLAADDQRRGPMLIRSEIGFSLVAWEGDYLGADGAPLRSNRAHAEVFGFVERDATRFLYIEFAPAADAPSPRRDHRTYTCSAPAYVAVP
jgi:hypothetical protein